MKRSLLLLCALFLTFNIHAFQQNNFSAFIYHRFGDDRFPSTNISLSNFESQLIFLQENDYLVLTFSEALEYIQKERKSAQIAVITIDDAYKSFYQNGWPLLKKYGFKASLYVNTETVGSKDFMSWDEINKINKAGIEIGNHSHGHPYFLDNFKAKSFTDDLLASHEIFQKNMGNIPKAYAYPYGEWNDHMASILDSMGYSYATAQNSGPIYKGSPLFHLPRFPMSDDYAELDPFKQKLTVDALEIDEIKIITEGYLGSTAKPRLLLNFNESMYDIRNLQCFIQGSIANKSIRVVKDSRVELSIWPETDLTNRRTLFTITVTDYNGNWHWFSFVYVLAKTGQ